MIVFYCMATSSTTISNECHYFIVAESFYDSIDNIEVLTLHEIIWHLVAHQDWSISCSIFERNFR